MRSVYVDLVLVGVILGAIIVFLAEVV